MSRVVVRSHVWSLGLLLPLHQTACSLVLRVVVVSCVHVRVQVAGLDAHVILV